MTAYEQLQIRLKSGPRAWLVTGVAGFIGSNLLEAYAAVIPKWTAAMMKGEDVFINGDGETSRDFCYVANAVQANLLAATVSDLPLLLGEGGGEGSPLSQVYNVALGDRTTLKQLFEWLKAALAPYSKPCQYREFRSGNVMHSPASITKAADLLGYAPAYRIQAGIEGAPCHDMCKRPKSEYSTF